MRNEKTIKDWFNEAIAMATEAGNQEMVEFFEGRIAALERKSEKAKEVKQEDVELQTRIKEVLTANGGQMTVTEIRDVGKFEESAPKITAMLTKMKKNGEVDKVQDKKKSYYFIA